MMQECRSCGTRLAEHEAHHVERPPRAALREALDAHALDENATLCGVCFEHVNLEAETPLAEVREVVGL